MKLVSNTFLKCFYFIVKLVDRKANESYVNHSTWYLQLLSVGGGG